MAEIPSTLDRLENLRQLVFSGTLIRVLNLTLLYALKELQHLKLAQNQLVDIIGKADGANATSKVKLMMLNDNQLTTINLSLFDPFPELAFLDVSYNTIRRLQGGLTGRKLNHITLMSNALRQLDMCQWDVLDSLEILEVSFNRLETIPDCMYKLPNVSHLLLEYNHITSLPLEAFADLQQLQELRLTFNKISTISFGSKLPDKQLRLFLFYNCLCGVSLPGNLTTIHIDIINDSVYNKRQLNCSYC
uniref:Leucine rich immune protein (Coil-less) n=1 Tax=Anopheles epiroticus TaxID=199890 RepID=A0A182PBH3_9DIPT